MNVKTNLLWYAKTESGEWTRFPVKAVGNGRLAPGVVSVNGRKKTYPEGYFQLRYREDGKLRYRNLGRDGAEAQRHFKEFTEGRQLQKRARGTAIEVVLPEGSPKTLATLRKDFLERKRKEGLSRNGISGYTTALDAFFNVCAKTYPQEVERKDILNALDRLRKDNYATHTIWNRYRRIKSFLEYAGADREMLKDRFGMKKPKGEGVEIYSAQELDRIFAYVEQIDEQDALVFNFALMTGCREREIAFMEWHNFDFDHDNIKVRNKSDLGFRVKDCEARDIPMLPELKTRLLAWREARRTPLPLWHRQGSDRGPLSAPPQDSRPQRRTELQPLRGLPPAERMLRLAPAQVPFQLRHHLPAPRRGCEDPATMAWPLGHPSHDALSRRTALGARHRKARRSLPPLQPRRHAG